MMDVAIAYTVIAVAGIALILELISGLPVNYQSRADRNRRDSKR